MTKENIGFHIRIQFKNTSFLKKILNARTLLETTVYRMKYIFFPSSVVKFNKKLVINKSFTIFQI